MLELSVVGVIVLGVLVLVACSRADRAKDFAAAGPSVGMQYSDDLPPQHAQAIRTLPSISRRTRNFFPRVLSNPDEMIFDWVWRDDRLKDRNRGTQTVVALRQPGARLPRFLLAEKDAVTREDARAAGEAVVFTSPAKWLDRYVLHGEDNDELRRLFPEEARATFELPPGVRVEGAGEWVIVYGPERDVDPSAFASEMSQAREIVSSWMTGGVASS